MTAFLAWLWQGLAVAAGVGLMLLAMPRLSAAVRHAAWWAALAAVVVLGGIHGATAWQPAGEVLVAGQWPAAPPRESPALLTLPGLPTWAVPLVFAWWAALALRGLSVLLKGLRHVSRLRADAVPVEPGRVARLTGWSGRPAGSRRARLCATDLAVGACALGFRDPIILVSRELLDTLDDAVLDRLVMHEQAHLDRFDDWLRLAQGAVTTLAAIHPAVYLVGGRLDVEREAACDDRVVSMTGSARQYAASLAEAAAVCAARLPVTVPAALGAGTGAGSARALRDRIVRLLDPRADRGHSLARPAVAVLGIWVTAVIVVAPCVPAIVAFAGAVEGPARTGTPPVLPLRGARSVVVAAPATEPTMPAAVARRPVGRAAVTGRASAPPVETVAQRALGDERVGERDLQAAGAEPMGTPGSGLTPDGSSVAGSTGEVPAALGLSIAASSDAPPVAPPAGRAGPAGAPGASGDSFSNDFSRLGRSSAATAKAMGLSLAGTAGRVGKAFGRFF